MIAPNDPDRRFTLALTAAVAATTVAVGVTAATLLGWFRASEPPRTAVASASDPAVVYVPITPIARPGQPAADPADPPSDRLAMEAPREHGHEVEPEDDDD